MRIILLTLLFILFSTTVLSQLFCNSSIQKTDSSFTRTILINQVNLSFGPSFGVHPNFRKEEPVGYYFFEGSASTSIKQIPFQIQFRQSNEELRFGRASFFKISFDQELYQKRQKIALNNKLNGITNEIKEQETLLYKLESKLSFIYQKLNEIKQIELNKPSQSSLDIIDLDSIKFANLTFPNLDAPELNVSLLNSPSLNDSIYDKKQELESNIEKTIIKIQDLNHEYNKLNAAINQLDKNENFNFFSGFKKIDLGLSTLSSSSISKNSIPIQGLHIQYKYNKYFTDLAAGYTFPNQLFSNQPFDQLLNNSGNIFNYSDFYQVNNVRFVSSAKIGYGDESKSFIAVENFYSGSSFKQNNVNSNTNKSISSNVSSCLSPKKWLNFKWSNSVGMTWLDVRDSISTNEGKASLFDKIAVYSSVEIKLPKLKSIFESTYRKIPSSYDGFIQGVYLNQTELIEFKYVQKLSNKLRISTRYRRDNFNLQNSINTKRLINSIGTNLVYQMNEHINLITDYSLLQLDEKGVVNPRSDLSHLIKYGAFYKKLIKKNEFTLSHDMSIAKINGFDSVQSLIQSNFRSSFRIKKLRVGLNFQYTEFSGLSRLFGKNYVLEPTIDYQLHRFVLSVSGQQLWSDQFKKENGLRFKTQFALSEYIDCLLNIQRFLPTEYNLFLENKSKYTKPLFVLFKINIHIK